MYSRHKATAPCGWSRQLHSGWICIIHHKTDAMLPEGYWRYDSAVSLPFQKKSEVGFI